MILVNKISVYLCNSSFTYTLSCVLFIYGDNIYVFFELHKDLLRIRELK